VVRTCGAGAAVVSCPTSTNSRRKRPGRARPGISSCEGCRVVTTTIQLEQVKAGIAFGLVEFVGGVTFCETGFELVVVGCGGPRQSREFRGFIRFTIAMRRVAQVYGDL
jgi:hypothetical protein